jgi:RNA polymerase sigma factor (sigma-70 family)
MVPDIARGVFAASPGVLAREDLVSLGHLGLVDAATLFEADRGHAFEAFARPRIEGAMKSGVRAELVRRRRRRRTRRAARLGYASACTEPGIVGREGAASSPRSRSSVTHAHLGALADALLLGGPSGRPDRAFERCQSTSYLRAVVAALFDALSEADQTFLELVFEEDATYEEVAGALGLSLATVKRRAKKLLKRLGIQLRARGLGPDQARTRL